MRDDFPASVIDVLAKRVSVRCSNPNCRRATSGPRNEISKAVNIGVAAHITAAAPGGPRYDPTLSEAERSHADNGIWLCQNCAKLIDNDPLRFHVNLLREWKTSSEKQADNALTGDSSSESEIGSRAKVLIRWRKISITSRLHDYRLELVVSNLGVNPFSEFHVDLIFPTEVLNSPDRHPLFVSGRSNCESSFFRFVSTPLSPPIFPGDQPVLIELDYYMNDQIFSKYHGSFGFIVSARLYCGARQPILMERPFDELQCF
jgi:hypothetical protein